MYQIPYEMTKRFMSDLIKAKNLPIFENLFSHFKDDMTRYEAKIALVMNQIPLMNKATAGKFMKIIEVVLQQPASNSIFKNNINPMRVGLMLYRLLVDMEEEHNYSEHSTEIMKEQLSSQIKAALEIYTDPEDMMKLVE